MLINHFDCRTGQWIHTDGKSDNPKSILHEKLDNTLLEAFFPDAEFSVGHIDRFCVEEDLKNHPDGMQLLISSKTRLIYGDKKTLDTIETKLCPDRKDRGAYGSIFIGDCNNAITKKLRILVVDDKTGENGGIIPDKVAKRLVGDCYGQISPDLATELSGCTDRVIQHRLGFLDEFRFAKGTLRPLDLTKIIQCEENKKEFDLIVPTSSFKGGDKENNPIKPGLIETKVWLGEKELSPVNEKTGRVRPMAISQVHASYPNGLKDYLLKIKQEAKELKEIQSDFVRSAGYYCKSFEARGGQEQAHDGEGDSNDNNTNNSDTDDDKQDPARRDFVYKAFKSALESGNHEVLKHPYFVKKMKDFYRKEWLNLATGRSILFDRAMIIPSKDLKNGEICVPWLKDGDKILNFRSPFLNSNGMCHSTNKHVEDMFGPDGQKLRGVIVVSDEDHERIVDRLNDEIQEKAKKLDITLPDDRPLTWKEEYKDLDPKSLVAEVDKLNEIINELNEKGFEINENIPYETESQRQARDYDGDCIGAALALLYPESTAEVIYRNLPENAYLPTLKEEKESFPPSMSFEEIAIHMSDQMTIGFINNHSTAVEALRSEIKLLKEVGTFQQRKVYCLAVESNYEGVLRVHEQSNNDPKNPDPTAAAINKFLPQISRIVDIVKTTQKNQTELNPENIREIFDLHESVYKGMVEFASYNNQIAVDQLKSSRTPDKDGIKRNIDMLHRTPTYIRDKKDKSVYRDRTISTNGSSPVELIINTVNDHFTSNQLEQIPTHQYKDLFEKNYSALEYNEATAKKKEFDRLYGRADAQRRIYENSEGPILSLQTKKGNIVHLHNVARCNHPLYKENGNLEIKIESNRKRNARHQLIAEAKVTQNKVVNGKVIGQETRWLKIGDVSPDSLKNLPQLKPGLEFTAKSDLKPPINKGQIDLMFKEATDAAKDWSESLPPEERNQYAAATWHCCHTYNKGGKNKEETNQFKTSNFVFYAFPDEILSQISQKQFNSAKVVELSQDGRTYPSDLIGQTVDLQITQGQNDKKLVTIMNPKLEKPQVIGPLSDELWQYPVGTTAKATLLPGTPSIAHLDIEKCPNIVFGSLDKYALAGNTTDGTPVEVSFEKNPRWGLKLDNKFIGTLDRKNVQILKDLDLNSNQLNVTLNSYGKDRGAYALANIQNTNIFLRVDLDGVSTFTDKNTTLTLAPIPTQVVQVNLHKNGKIFPTGQFNEKHPPQRTSLKQLTSRGLINKSQPIPASIKTVSTHIMLKVEPDSLTYPDRWYNLPPQNPDRVNSNPQSIPNGRMANKLIHLPSFFHESTHNWGTEEKPDNKDTLGITVDSKLKDQALTWLSRIKPPPTTKCLDSDDRSIALESKLGYSLILIDKSTLSAAEIENLINERGDPLQADFNDNSKSSYHDKLHSTPKLSKEIRLFEREKPELKQKQVLQTFTIDVDDIPEFTIPPRRTNVVKVEVDDKDVNSGLAKLAKLKQRSKSLAPQDKPQNNKPEDNKPQDEIDF